MTHKLLGFFISLAVVFTVSIPVMAVDVFDDCAGVPSGESRICSNRDSGTIFSSGSVLRNGLQIFIFAVGFAAVVMVVVGGFKYVLSRGDPQATASARNTILYAVIGLVIALASQGILRFVIDRV